jgi:hypothetical protein
MGDASNIQMHNMVAMLQQLQQENANLRNAMEQLQVARAPIHVDTLPSSLLDPLEGLSMLNCEKLELEGGRSQLPALKGVRGAC